MADKETTTAAGITFGSAFALVLSWTTWHSFWWAILHSIFGWLYVIYYFLIANHDVIWRI